MFTHRQLSLLSYLISNRDGLSGSYLSGVLNISTKTIQSEIKAINQLLSDEERIIFLPGKGYTIKMLKEATRNRIASEINQDKQKVDDSSRGNKIMMILLFEKDYITMENLAGRLFISKSAISKDFGILWRMRRYIHISPVKGLKINAPESDKRLLLCKTFDRDDQILKLLNLYEEYLKLENPVQSILKKSFIEHGYIISGDQLVEFQNYFVMSIIRNQHGFPIEDSDLSIQISALMHMIIKKIESIIDYQFKKYEIVCCQKKLNELNLLNTNKRPAYLKEVWNHLELCLDLFLGKIKEDLNLTFDDNEQFRDMFIMHMYKLKIRTDEKHSNMNLFKRETNSQYPMTAHIIREYFLPIFDLAIPESEIGYIILYFGAGLESSKDPLPGLLISNFKPAMLYHSVAKIQNQVKDALLKIETMPQYQYEDKSNVYNIEFPIIITTERELLLQNSKMILVNPIIKSKDVKIAGDEIENAIRSHWAAKFNNTMQTFINKDSFILVEDDFSSIQDFFKFYHIEYVTKDYDIVMDNHVVFSPKFFYHEEKSFIKIFILKDQLKYKSRDIEFVIESGYNIKDNCIKDFYGVIKLLFQSSKTKKIFESL